VSKPQMRSNEEYASNERQAQKKSQTHTLAPALKIQLDMFHCFWGTSQKCKRAWGEARKNTHRAYAEHKQKPQIHISGPALKSCKEVD